MVCDADETAWIERFSRTDRTLAPAEHDLLQTEIGIRPGETLETALQRLHSTQPLTIRIDLEPPGTGHPTKP